MFTPPSFEGTLAFPGNVGGVNWGSAAYDPARHIMVANTNRLIAWVKLIPRDKLDTEYHQHQDNRIYTRRIRRSERRSLRALSHLPLLSSKAPCDAPPWGTTEAVDLFTGKQVWDVPLGTMIPWKADRIHQPRWTDNHRGRPGFHLRCDDLYLHAFDSDSGKELWKYQLPAGGQATPMTYIFKGKQYLVIAAGGHGKLGTKQGDYVLAFALP